MDRCKEMSFLYNHNDNKAETNLPDSGLRLVWNAINSKDHKLFETLFASGDEPNSFILF